MIMRRTYTSTMALGAALAFSTFSTQAAAQEAPEVQDTAATQAETGGSEIVVTGSRIARDGFNAPTPLTVIGAADMEASPASNIADFVNEMPSLVGSSTPANSNLNISTGAVGVNALNLRSLGASRTLVLLDGQRSVGSTLTGIVDVNNMPQALVKSVEIVTGGASAAYGSDAVSGVVNFILDHDFTGLKGNAEIGETTYGDGRNYRLALSGGTPFAGGRGHVLLSAEYTRKDGIHGVPRNWNDRGWYIINNPAYVAGNGQPERLVTNQAGLSNASPGGIITSGPLKGTYFGIGGVPGQFAYGTTRDPWMIGGDWESVQVNSNQSLDPEETRIGLFGRMSYEFSDAFKVFAQVSWNRTENEGWLGVQLNQANVTIRSDNAFLPQSIRDQMTTLGLSSFVMGTTNADLPIRKSVGERETQRYVIGANGSFDALGTAIRWDAYYQHGVTTTMEMAADITNNARLALAQDAVFAPVGNAMGVAAGTVVCRSSLTNPGNGCVPFNRIGIDVNNQAALDYVLGDPFRNQRFQQDMFAVNFGFDAFNLPAGAVSIALGAEHRKEKVSGTVDPQFQSGWFVGNFLATQGRYHVSEAYLEMLVPIFEGVNFNGAVRGTDYSTSGFVTTWKAGLTIDTLRDIRFRITRSRDIRAPNLGELFTSGSTRTNVLIDPFNGNQSLQFSGTTTGNLALQPEKADQWGAGVVLQPRFIPGFAMSVDYFDIKLKDGIGTVAAQTIIDRCFDGVAAYCSAIVRGANGFGTNLQIFESPFNFATQRARGLDIEASYRLGLDQLAGSWNGNLTLRAMATRYLENSVDNGLDAPSENVGQNAPGGTPKWLYRVSASLDVDPVTLTLTGRGVSSGVYDNAFVECTSACPASTATNRTINRNRIAGAFYVDMSMSYGFDIGGAESQIFASVTNLFNRDPAMVASGPAGSAYATPATNQSLYDLLGRTFRVGVRFKL